MERSLKLKNNDFWDSSGIVDGTTPLNIVLNNIRNSISEVVSSGSNSNGNYIKFADGTMVCTAEKSTGVINWTKDNVANIFTASGTFDDFPQTFITVPHVVKSIEYVTPSNRYIDMCGQGAPSTTNAGSYNLKTYWNASNTNVRISYIAIGKWK